MHLHILFCPAQSIAPDGSRLPTSSLPLTLNDEVQYRCAGFIQAEIERYAEELEEASPVADLDSENDDDSGDDHSENERHTKGGKTHVAKGKQPAKGTSQRRFNILVIGADFTYVYMNVQAIVRLLVHN